jgi:tetratricopeptide (TPR) repeat protein
MFLLNIIASIFILLHNPEWTIMVILACAVYMFYSVNKYLYSINNILFLNVLTKILFFKKTEQYKLAWIYYNNKYYNKSIKILKKLKNIESYFLLANNYEEIHDYEKAIDYYSKILLTDKNERPEILYNRGAKYKKIGKYDEAINDFIACINCKKPDPKAYIALGVIKDELHEYEEAKKYFEKGKSIDNSFDEYIPEKYK